MTWYTEAPLMTEKISNVIDKYFVFYTPDKHGTRPDKYRRI